MVMMNVELAGLARGEIVAVVSTQHIVTSVLIEVEFAVHIMEKRFQLHLPIVRRKEPVRRDCRLKSVVSHDDM